MRENCSRSNHCVHVCFTRSGTKMSFNDIAHAIMMGARTDIINSISTCCSLASLSSNIIQKENHGTQTEGKVQGTWHLEHALNFSHDCSASNSSLFRSYPSTREPLIDKLWSHFNEADCPALLTCDPGDQ